MVSDICARLISPTVLVSSLFILAMTQVSVTAGTQIQRGPDALAQFGLEIDPEIYGKPTISYAEYIRVMDAGGLSYWASQSQARAQVQELANQGERIISVSIALDKPPQDRADYQAMRATSPSRQALYEQTFRTLRDADSASVHGLIERLGGTFHAETRFLVSTILADIPASAAPAILAHPHVKLVTQLHDLKPDLANSVPQIGGQALQSAGLDGQGIKIGILDSGLDYTHAAFGGPGTESFYLDSAYFGPLEVCPTGLEASCYFNQDPNDLGLSDLFGPSASQTNVRGGFDFVGESWPFGPLNPNPNPIDREGHGTHVADIAAGIQGVAPGAELHAYKVCSAVAGSCSGIAIYQGLLQAFLDGMDVVNLSLGAPYGQPVSSSSYLIDLMAVGGVVVVASAGNSGDRAFVSGSPASASGAISVAQLAMPTAFTPAFELYNGTGDENRVTVTQVVHQTWSVMPTIIDLPLIFGDGAGGNTLGCDSFGGTDLSGLVVLVDRGACNFSLKAANAGAAGAAAVLIGMNDASAPFDSASGGHEVTIPALMIAQSVANDIRNRLINNASPAIDIDPSRFISQADSTVASSSRGPRNHDNILKPEIGAPGASISAIAGSGDATRGFGGTSGAAPMVAGAAALLLQHFNINEGRDLKPFQIKALMMNHAFTEIFDSVPGLLTAEGTPSPISRVGAGRVAVGEAPDWAVLAYDATDTSPLKKSGALSLSYQPTSQDTIVERTLRVHNLSAGSIDLEPAAEFRFTDDAISGAVSVAISPASAVIAEGDHQDFTVSFTINAANLFATRNPLAFPNRGSQGGFAGASQLTFYEFDGHIRLRTSGGGDLLASVPWHMLPKAVGDIAVSDISSQPGLATATVDNVGEVPASIELFRLYDENPSWGLVAGDCLSLGLFPGCDQDGVDLKHIGFDDSPDVFGPSDGLMFFAVSTWDPPYRAGQFPGSFHIFIDIDRDGEADFLVVNNDLNLLTGAPGLDGRNAVATFNLSNGAGNIFFLVDSKFNSNVWVLPSYTVNSPSNSMVDAGLATGELFDFWVAAANNYHGGFYDCAPSVPDLARPFTDGEATCRSNGAFTARYGGPVFETADYSVDIGIGASQPIEFTLGAQGASELGALIVNRYGPVGKETLAVPLNIADLIIIDELFKDRFEQTEPESE
jgi:minor extracellular serine protease Vpr